MQEIGTKLAGISSYVGSFSISQLINVPINKRIIFLTVDLEEAHVALAIYTSDRGTEVYICDPLGVLSAGLPPKLIEFLEIRFTNTCVTISEQLSTTCTYYIISFVTFMSKYHSFCKFVGHFTNNFDFNDYILNYVL